MTILNRIEELRAEGKDLKKIRAYLIIEDYSNKDIEAAIKELGLTQKKATGLTQVDILEYFSEEPRTEHDLYTLLLEKAVVNECRWVNDRNKIRLLTIAIYKKGGYVFDEVPASKELKTLVAAKVKNKGKAGEDNPEAETENETENDDAREEAWDNLKKAQANWAKGKKPRKNTFHPDKIEYLGDEFLTKAYNDFQAEMNNAA